MCQNLGSCKTVSHDSLILKFYGAKDLSEKQMESPNGCAKCRWGRLKLMAFDK